MSKKKILAFAASNSKQSINKKLVTFAAKQLKSVDVTFLDLNDFEMPIYSIDRENESGIHPLAKQFKEEIKKADGIVISFAEHNGAYSAAFKYIFDWVSRINNSVWENKPMFLLATAPGGWGGKSVLGIASARFKRGNSSTIAEFSLPSFGKNFSEEKGISNNELNEEFNKQKQIFELAL